MMTRYGVPLCVTRRSTAIGITTLAAASAGSATQYGAPSAKVSIVLAASAQAPSVHYGVASAIAALRASGACATQYGVPSTTAAHRALGASSTAYGAPRAAYVVRAPGQMATHYGTPSIKGAASIQAQGACATQYGTPGTGLVAHALPCAPSARFGRPTVLRGTRC